MNEAIIALIISTITPGLVAVAKWLKPKIPKLYLPIMATLIGPVLELLRALFMQQAPDLLILMLSGPGGIGIRELVDQVLKALGLRERNS